MPIVLAYGRVSSERQADAGALERQEQSLLKESGADEVITDVGSGTNTNRPGYQRMLEMIKAGQVSKIVVADQDRLNRQVAADLELWSLCEQHGTTIETINGRPIEFRTPDGALLGTISSARCRLSLPTAGFQVTDRRMPEPLSARNNRCSRNLARIR